MDFRGRNGISEQGIKDILGSEGRHKGSKKGSIWPIGHHVFSMKMLLLKLRQLARAKCHFLKGFFCWQILRGSCTVECANSRYINSRSTIIATFRNCYQTPRLISGLTRNIGKLLIEQGANCLATIFCQSPSHLENRLNKEFSSPFEDDERH